MLRMGDLGRELELTRLLAGDVANWKRKTAGKPVEVGQCIPENSRKPSIIGSAYKKVGMAPDPPRV